MMASRPDLGHLFGQDFRIGIGHGEDDRIFRHALDHRRGQGAGNREAEENIGPVHGIGQAPGLGVRCMGGFPLVHAFGAALVNHAF